MRTLLAASAALVLVAFAGAGIVEACGAKFLVATRNVMNQKMQRAATTGSVLVYQHADDPEERPEDVAESAAELRRLLEGVGHSVVVASDEDALRDLVSRDGVDVVMMGPETARRLKTDVAAWSPGTPILPVAVYPTSAERAQLKDEFGDLSVVGDGQRAFLASIERSLARN
jgi:CheY-like chemotaxis protein